MDEKKRPLAETIISMLNILIKGQKRIEFNTVQIAQILEAFSRKYEFNMNNGVNFIISGMTEAQAKSLLKQGMYPEVVALYSGNKFTVEHLYKLVNGGKKQ